MIRRLALLTILLSAFEPAFAQGVIGTFAGTDSLFPSGPQLPLSAPLGQVEHVALDASGNLYVSGRADHVVVKVSADGTLAAYAGNGLAGFSGDNGQARNASLRTPVGLAVDAAGSLFISDQFDHRVRRVTPDGIITTVAGTGSGAFTGDGPAASRALNQPRGLAVDSSGNLYIADSANQRVRKVSPGGVMSTFAGTGVVGSSGDGGPALQASLNVPTAVAVDGTGAVYIATQGGVRKVASNGTITTVSTIGSPAGLAVDKSDNLYISSGVSSTVSRLTPSGTLTLIAGNGSNRFTGDGGPAIEASLNNPGGLAITSGGILYIADRDNFRVRRVDADGSIRTAVGNGRYHFAGDGQPAISANLSQPSGVALDASGNVFIADLLNNRIRKVTTDGIITTVAGTDVRGFSGDGGPATSAALANPQGVTAAPSGLFIADRSNNVVRKVDLQGVIQAFAGGGSGFGSDVVDGGAATKGILRFPAAVAFDSAGNAYIADRFNDRIRKVTPAGTISTVAGGGSSAAEGINATDAQLSAPQGVVVDAQNRIFISDTDNNRIRMVADGKITTIAGGGSATGENVPAATARVDSPRGLALDASGNLYFAEFNANRVRRIASGQVATVAGAGGSGGFSGDGGLAVNALLDGPSSVAFDRAGNLFVADSNNNRVRTVFAAPPGVRVSPLKLSFSAVAGGIPTAPRLLSISSDQLSGLPFAASLQNKSSWLTLFPNAGPLPASLEISVDPSQLKAGSYQDTLRISTPNANPPFTDVPIDLNVSDPGQPLKAISPSTLSFAFIVNTQAKAQTITVANLGGGSVSFTVAADTAIPTKWLSVSPSSGVATLSKPVEIAVTANPGNLPEGTYTGTVTILTGGNPPANVPVTMTISRVEQTIRLSQSGMTFTGVSGGSLIPPQTFSVLNTGRGVMKWNVSVEAQPGAPTFLSLGALAGSTDAASLSVPSVSVSANAQKLAPGEYFNQIRADSPTALNSPQYIPVVLEVLRPDQNPGPAIQPSELVFAAVAGGPAPSSQDLNLYNVAGSRLNYRSQKTTANGINWLAYLPSEASVDANGPRRVVVQPDTTLLSSPGVNQGVLTLNFDDGSSRKVNLLAVVIPPASSRGASSLRSAQSECVAKDLVISTAALGQDFVVPAGYPANLLIQVVDDCNVPMTEGSVIVSFNNGDPPLRLNSIGEGSWQESWVPSFSTQGITLTVTAESAALGLEKTRQIAGSSRSTRANPAIGKGGIVNAASNELGKPLAPGAYISIYGQDLAAGDSTQAPPYPTSLGGTSVFVAGHEIPLTYAGSKQLNALLPYTLAPNAEYQLLVVNGDRYSNPERFVLAPAAPAIFQTGVGPAVVNLKGSVLTRQNPARPGDTVVVFAAGLGPVTPGAPSGALPTATPLMVSIGGIPAAVSYAGLTPQFPGLYQVNVTIPSNVPAGDVTLVMTILGSSSPEVRIPIER